MLGDWTLALVDQTCGAAHGGYKRSLEARYTAYFAAHPELAGEHQFKAASMEAALPAGFGVLGAEIAPNLRHRHYLSGGSSQVVALGMLGAAAQIDPSLAWLSAALALEPFDTSRRPQVRFEYEVSPTLLGERPWVTTIDCLVQDDETVLCVEAKLWEAGMGTCSCGAERASVSDCSRLILGRAAYWETAEALFGLPPRLPGKQCPISLAYQAIRCVAAARALAGGGRSAGFALVYDERNPYFTKTGTWPGWPAVLRESLARAASTSAVSFRAVSWQRLLNHLPSDAALSAWAAEKHGLDCDAL